ncbi:MAG TPA: GGDEF domain-containing protein [Candidatus Baltobacteraceae bacterium]|nr:GGDEF domain-containing protein [Candidatus Baltobacteraceae bacterium]
MEAWRTREGTALLVYYGALIALIFAAIPYAGKPAHLFAGVPFWLRFAPVAAAVTLVAAVYAVPPLRAHAYRLQLFNVSVFLLAVVAVCAHRGGPGATLAMALCMFGVQYAFMRWEDLVAAYALSIGLYEALAAASGVLLSAQSFYTAEILAAVALVCIALGSLRLRSTYAAASERFALEQQTAELRRQTERNARMARTDQLTGLLNRAGMNDLIDRALVLAKNNGTQTALLYLDLDGFKKINDACGHDAGDLALVEAALRLQYHLRFGETAGRIGGDEFVIVLPWVNGIEEAQALARRIEEALAEPFQSGGHLFPLSASIGIALGACGDTRLDLLSAADNAMYEVKRRRKGQNLLAVADARGV